MSEAAALIERLSAIDVRAAVHCAAACLEAALDLAPPGQDTPARVLALARAWLGGEATTDDAGRLLFEVERSWTGISAEVSLCLGSCALARAVQLSEAQTAGPLLAQSLQCLVAARAHAASREQWQSGGADPFASAEAFRRQADQRLLGHLLAQRWPLTCPAPSQIQAAPSALQVAWDAVASTPRTDLSVPELLEVHERALRLGLIWEDAAQRAVAERAVDEALVRQILGRS